MSEGTLPPWRGIELEIADLIVSNKALAVSVDKHAKRSTVTRGALVVLAVVVTVIGLLGLQVRGLQGDLALAQANLRASQCDTASLWLSLLDLPQPEPDPPLTAEEQAQADATRAEFKQRYTDIYTALDCASLER